MEKIEKEIEKRKEKVLGKFKSWLKDPYNLTFFIILIAAFIIRIWIFTKTSQQPIWWDEADYMSTAKRWGLNLDIKDTWYYRRGFLWPLICSVFFRIGLGEIGIRFFIVLLSAGIVALTYFLISLMFNKKIALLASLAAAVSWIYLFFTGRTMTEIPATFFLLLATLFFWKGYVKEENKKFMWLFALFLALSVLVRFQFAMMAFPFFLFILIRERGKMFKNENLWLTLIIFLLVLSPLLYIYTKHYGNPITDIASYYFDVGQTEETGHWHWAGIFNYFKDLPYILSVYLLVPFLIGNAIYFSDLIFGFDKIFSSPELQKKLFILFFIAIPFLVLGYMGALYVEQRYIMMTLPFIYSIASMPFIYAQKFFKSRALAYFFVIVFMLLLIPNFTLGKNLTESKATSYLEVKEAALWMKQNSNPGDTIITMSVPQTIYYSERMAYSYGGGPNQDKFQTPEEMESLAREVDAKYFVVSVFEPNIPQWAYTYGQTHPNNPKPVQAYAQGQQPVLVIYEFIK
ncbi:MAG: glycosyltransferase family 39 protein [Nanoarchaeota archaeon]